MRCIPPEGWLLPWPGDIKDKRLGLDSSAIVYAWPTTGGRLELRNPSALELDFLGVKDHFAEANSSANIAEEDAFVRRLRCLGGTFYEYQYGIRVSEHFDEEIHTWLGWPEDEEHKGGAWVLKLKQAEMIERMTGRIRLARDMQERCQAIEMCGGVFYSSPAEEHLVAMDPKPELSRLEAEEQERRQDKFRSSLES